MRFCQSAESPHFPTISARNQKQTKQTSSTQRTQGPNLDDNSRGMCRAYGLARPHPFPSLRFHRAKNRRRNVKSICVDVGGPQALKSHFLKQGIEEHGEGNAARCKGPIAKDSILFPHQLKNIGESGWLKGHGWNQPLHMCGCLQTGGTPEMVGCPTFGNLFQEDPKGSSSRIKLAPELGEMDRNPLKASRRGKGRLAWIMSLARFPEQPGT